MKTNYLKTKKFNNALLEVLNKFDALALFEVKNANAQNAREDFLTLYKDNEEVELSWKYGVLYNINYNNNGVEVNYQLTY